MPRSPLSTLGYVLLPPVLILPNGKKATLTPAECALFALLRSDPGTPMSRLKICLVLGFPYAPASRKVDALVGRLRKKMGKSGTSLVSVYGKGYAFVPK